MFQPLSFSIGLRYLRAKRRNGFISFISLASILGILIGVMALITTISVMNGFQSELRERMLAATAHEFAERENRGAVADFNFNLAWFIPGYLAAVAIHTAFNQFPDQPIYPLIATLAVAPFLIMGMFRFGAVEAQQWLTKERELHAQALAAWQSGGYPADGSGRKIAALVARSDPATGENIREYCEQLTFLAWTAEDALHDQFEDVSKVEVEAEAGAAFDRLEALRKAIGKSSFAALKPLLPFSRNDYWEISELEERLKAKKVTPR